MPDPIKLEDAIEFAENPEPRCPCVLLLDTSGSMEGEPVAALNKGLVTFRENLVKDSMACRRVEVAVVTFDNEVKVVIVRGSGGTFSAGHDLGTPEGMEYRDALGAEPGIQIYDQFKKDNLDLGKYAIGTEGWNYKDGKQYALPMDWATGALYYNKDLLAKAGYTSLIANTENDEQRERIDFDAMRARQVDGFITATARLDDELLAEMAASGQQIVLVNRRMEDGSLSSVAPDDRMGIHLAVDHVAGLGHRRIAHVGQPGAVEAR